MVEVSVVTVVKNDASGLMETCSSLLNQVLSDWEMIIVVGSSEDGTLTLAKELEAVDARVHVVEQMGSGIYRAMNDGIALARGKFMWFMNAGDSFFSPMVLSHAVNEISKEPISIVIGGYQVLEGNLGRTYAFSTKNISWRDFAFTRRGGCHQAMIFRTQVLRDHGGFNTEYSLASDFDLVLRILNVSQGKRVSEIYASIAPGGRADKGILLVHDQKQQIRQELLRGPFIIALGFIWTRLARLKISLRRILEPPKN